MKRAVISFVSLLFWGIACAAEAQGPPFNGWIVNNAQQGISRVVVRSKMNPDKFTISDKKGRFGLTNVLPTDTLILHLKRTEVLIPVDGRKALLIVWNTTDASTTCHEDQGLVDQGYGYVKRREYSGFGSGISGDDLRRTGAVNLVDALLLRVPGLHVAYTDAGPILTFEINSLVLDSEPLYIIDGVMVSDLSFVDIYDVESVEVMRNASIYGSRGANGAIIIHTKK